MVSLEYFLFSHGCFSKKLAFVLLKKNIKDERYEKKLILCLNKMFNIYAIMLWMW
jgi:hypothetical protein